MNIFIVGGPGHPVTWLNVLKAKFLLGPCVKKRSMPDALKQGKHRPLLARLINQREKRKAYFLVNGIKEFDYFSDNCSI